MAKAAITPVTGSGSYTVPADKYAIINVILQGEATTVQAKLKINGTLVALDGTATSDEDHPVVLNGITLNAGSVATLQVTGSGDGARALLTGFEYDA